MKLRTRLSLISGGVILLATLFSGGLIFRMYFQSGMEQVALGAAQKAQEVFRGFEAYSENVRGFDANIARYYLKSQNDDFSILLEGGRTVYNQTILDPAQIPLGEEVQTPLGIAGSRYFYGGRRLLVFSQNHESGLTLLHICDITDAYLDLYAMAGRMALISLVTVAGAILLLWMMLRRSLRPLGQLSQGARSIAAGAYGMRVVEGRNDEIGQLGQDFNKMAQAVEEHIAQVEESEEKKTLFMGSLTHELKTPLTAISGYAQTLRRVKLNEEDRDMALDYIYRESQRLDRLSKKMLRLLELDLDTELYLEPVEFQELLGEARRACLPQAESKGVELVMEACPGEMEGDRDLMTDAVINLVDNAVKASAPGNQVRMYAQDGTIVVEDQGRGIPQEELGRLTKPFYMVDKSRSRKSGGAGLGLALTEAILRRHGMCLEIESQPGQGTRAVMKQKEKRI